MSKKALLVAAALVLGGFATGASAQKVKATPTPTGPTCTPAAQKLTFTQAQADLVMSSYCKGISSTNIALMVAPLTKAQVESIVCANKPWPAGVAATVTCP